jgi:hypothetical protein
MPPPSAPLPAPPAPTPLPDQAPAPSPHASRYPIALDVETPDRIARWRPIAQWILAIPLFIVAAVLRILAELCAVLGWFAALFTGRLPDALGDLITGYYRYVWRAVSYSWFLRETYPPFVPELSYADSGDDPARFDVRPGEGLSRLAVLFRIILVIPQAIVVALLSIVLSFAVLVAFFAVTITGRWPAGLRSFVVGGGRWVLRVDAWFWLLANPYPPFSLR